MALPKWLYLLQMLGPAILNSFGVPAELTGAIVDGVNEAEQLPGASGADKKQHVLSIVGDAIVAVNAAKGRQLLDPLRVQTLVSGAINTVVEAVDLVHDATTDPNQLNVPHPSNVEPAIPASTSTLQHALQESVATPAARSEPSDAPPPTSAPPAHDEGDHEAPSEQSHPASTDHKGNAEKRHNTHSPKAKGMRHKKSPPSSS